VSSLKCITKFWGVIISLPSVPSQIEQSSVSVYRMERDSDQLSVLFTWIGLNFEQAGGVLLQYVFSLYITHPRRMVSIFMVYVNYVQVVDFVVQ